MSINIFLKNRNHGNSPITIDYAKQFTHAIFNIFWDKNFLRKQKITQQKLKFQSNYGNKILNLELLCAIVEIVKIKNIKSLLNITGCLFLNFNKSDALLLAHLLTCKNNKFIIKYGNEQEKFIKQFCSFHVLEYINFHISNDYSMYHRVILPQLALACYNPLEDIFKRYDTVYVQEKYDGERVIIKFYNNKFTFSTRNGTELYFKKEKLLNIYDYFKDYNKEFIVDAELVYINEIDEILPFQLKNKYENNNIRAKCLIFDILQYGGSNCQKLPFIERFKLLNNIVKDSYLVETKKITNIEELNEILNEKFANNKEGIIIRPNIVYSENQRTIFKIKKLYTKYKVDIDLAVLGASYNINKKLGILHCGAIKNGKIQFLTKVSSGLTQRLIDYFTRTLTSYDKTKNSNEFVEKYKDQITMTSANNPNVLFNGSIIIQVYGDSWSEDGHSIRFPIFQCIRNDKIYPDTL